MKRAEFTRYTRIFTFTFLVGDEKSFRTQWGRLADNCGHFSVPWFALFQLLPAVGLTGLRDTSASATLAWPFYSHHWSFRYER